MNWILALACVIAALATVSGKKILCQKDEDCGEGQCCMAKSAFQVATRGICKDFAKRRQQCSKPDSKIAYNDGEMYLLACPCQEGLTCQSRLSKDHSRFLKSLRCQVSTSTTAPDITVPDDGTGDEGTGGDGTGDEVTGGDGTGDEVTGGDGTGDEGTGGDGDEGTGGEGDGETDGEGDEETGEEGDEETGGEGDEETGGEGDEGTGGESVPEEIGQGPGGEPPRDDDCIDWEYPC